jgi:septal ring factor EnvC (AmiA/AmiB activator)
MEEYRRRELNYEQALNAYQRRLAEITADTRIQELENSNAQYRELLESAEARIRNLENTLREISTLEPSASADRLRTLRSSAWELENRISVNER